MSPHSTFADCTLTNAFTLIDNCLVLSFRKCELFTCQTVGKYSSSYPWPSDVSDRTFSPELSLQSPPSPCFSYSASEAETLKNDVHNGWSLFQSFVKENSNCFWNPSLIASVNSIEFRGFILPCNLLITGSDFDLQVIRSSWSQMTLKAPQGYAIESLGDMPTVEMTTVDQTHFTPLSEALCSCIHSLNIDGTAAFPHLIMDSLRQKYPHLTPPSFDMIKAALKVLQNEGKLRYISSRGFVVLPPEINSTTNRNRLSASRSNANDSPPRLMSNEQAIGKLHGIPGEAEITFRSFGVQVDESKLSSSRTSAVTPQYAFDCDIFADNKCFANDSASSLKRSASLRVYSEKSKPSDEKSFSFMRSKSLKLQRERHTKSFGHETMGSPKAEKKPSMFSKLFTRLSNASQAKRTESVTESAVNSKKDVECKSTQTAEATKKTVKSETLKSFKPKSVQNNGYSYSHYMPCTCSAYIDQRQYTGCVERCAYESGRFLCLTELDPNCRHCMASLTNPNVCCNEFVSNGHPFEKQMKPRPPQTGKAITATGARTWSAVDSIRPKTPLKLNNNKTVSNEKMKPIAMQTNAIRENNTIPAKASEQSECHLAYIDEQNTAIVKHDDSMGNTIVCNQFSDNFKKAENDSKRTQTENSEKKSNSDYKLASANSVNVKIEIGSKLTAASRPTETLSSRNVSSDGISGSNLGQRLIAKCVDDPKLSMDSIKVNDSSRAVGKKANVTSTTVTATMTVPDVSVTAENHNFTVNTITKTNANRCKSERILPLKFNETGKVLSLDDCTCKQKNLIVNALNADLKKNDEHHISSLSNIREKVAKAKAAFFSSNIANPPQIAK